MLEVESLSKSYQSRPAVAGVSFEIAQGEVVGFLGQNGAGKSTTMRMIAGVLDADEGDARLLGKSILSERKDAQRHVGYLPEGAPLYLDMTPRGYLRFLGDCLGLAMAARRDAIDRVVADARISAVADQPISSLSKGYRRRVSLAGALLNDPPVLLLDEPLDGLDPIQKRAVRALIARMAPEKAILISTHTLEDVGMMCSRVLIVDHGMIVADDTPDALAARSNGGLEATFVDLVSTEDPRR